MPVVMTEMTWADRQMTGELWIPTIHILYILYTQIHNGKTGRDKDEIIIMLDWVVGFHITKIFFCVSSSWDRVYFQRDSRVEEETRAEEDSDDIPVHRLLHMMFRGCVDHYESQPIFPQLDWQFSSRPNLEALYLILTVEVGGLELGYTRSLRVGVIQSKSLVVPEWKVWLFCSLYYNLHDV